MSRLREIRKEKNRRIHDLAAETGITVATLYRYEWGTRNPHIVMRRAIAQALDVEVEDIWPS